MVILIYIQVINPNTNLIPIQIFHQLTKISSIRLYYVIEVMLFLLYFQSVALLLTLYKLIIEHIYVYDYALLRI